VKIYTIRQGRLISAAAHVIWPEPKGRKFVLPVGRGTTANGYNLRIAMPAVLEEDLSLAVENRTILLRGARREPEGFGMPESKRFGLPYGNFQQKISLPDGLNGSKIKARFHHGVLDIHIPFRQESVTIGVTLDNRRQVARVA
jgi:HSP20 family molecular chaperone IbpA